MKPKAGSEYLVTAADFAAQSSTDQFCITNGSAQSEEAVVYYIDPENEEMKIAYPNLLFDRNIIDGRGMMCSFLTLAIGNNQGMGDVEYGKIYDIYFPPNVHQQPAMLASPLVYLSGGMIDTSCQPVEPVPFWFSKS